MSKQPEEPAPLDKSTARVHEQPPPQHQFRSTPAPTSSYAPRSVAPTPNSGSPTSLRPAGNGRIMELPPLPHALSVSGGSFSPASRSAGVSSILNPAEPDQLLHGRRRKASQLDSPGSSAPALPPLTTTSYPAQRYGGSTTPAPMSATSSSGERAPRRILTPRSPSLHRAASLNHLNPPSATFSAQQTPFPVSPGNRTYSIEPGTADAPPLPTPPAAVRHQYGFSAPTPHIQHSRRSSMGASRGMRLPSESTSPRSSYSSYSQVGQASPGSHAAMVSMPTLSAAYPDVALGSHGAASVPSAVGPDRQRAVGVPLSSSGSQNVYQMMTLETTSGTVQLPVDVQAASRVADEKRKRNAGASARFRQRRKEKEKEASTTISRLEQQVKELGEDMEFYKRERDYFVGVLHHVPGGERHFPRPQSPRHQRSGSNPARRASAGAGYIPIQEHVPRSPEQGRIVRRRTSTLSLPPPQGQMPTPMPVPGPGYPPTYNPQAYPLALAPQTQPPSHQTGGPLPASLHSRSALPPPLQPGPPQLMQAPPQTGPWNPYADRRVPPGTPMQGRGNR